MQLFSTDAIVFSKKKSNFFFDPEKMKKLPSKVAHNRPLTFFSVLARLPKRPKNRNPVPLMQDWVFRLMSVLNSSTEKALFHPKNASEVTRGPVL